MERESPSKTLLHRQPQFNPYCDKSEINEANQDQLLADENSRTQNKISFSQQKPTISSQFSLMFPNDEAHSKAQRKFKNAPSFCEDQQKPKLKITKCWNISCKGNGPVKTVKSVMHDHKQYQLCDVCSHHYDQNNYCQYCEEIYNPARISETHQWLVCFNCSRMNHQQCQQNHRKKQNVQLTLSYECITCQADRLASKKSKKNKFIIQQYQRKHEKMLLDFLKRRKTFFQQKEKKNPLLFQRVDLKFPNAENVFRRQNFSLALTRQQTENDLRRLQQHSKLKEKIDL